MAFYKYNPSYDERIMVIDESDNSITYKQGEMFSDDLKKVLKPRSLVFAFCSNSIGSVLGYRSFLENGIVPVLLNETLDKQHVENLLSLYCPSYLYIPHTMKVYFSNFEAVLEGYGYVLLKTNYVKKYPLYDGLALLLTTSGSTGSPKLVRQSYKNIESNAEAIVRYLSLSSEERPITTLPMNYTYGLSVINSHLEVGATLLLTNKSIIEKKFWEFFKKNGATSFGGVPYTYEMLDKLSFFRMNLPTLKTMTQAGGKLSTELHSKFAKFAERSNINFVVMYGQTEATARMAYLPSNKSLEKIGSIGVAIPGGRFSLKDSNGNVISLPDEIGELVYEGPNVTLGYAISGLDLNKGDERHGMLFTGDMAKKDKDGFYYIVGRKKRFLKIYGNRVNLDEIDQLIKRQFEGIDCASTGLDDQIYIFITEKGITDEVRSFISEKTGLNYLAVKVKQINIIPRNEAGKTLYKELERYYD